MDSMLNWISQLSLTFLHFLCTYFSESPKCRGDIKNTTSQRLIPDAKIAFLFLHWKQTFLLRKAHGWGKPTSEFLQNSLYLISSCRYQFNKESSKAYKSLKSYNFFVSGHVQNVCCHAVEKKSKIKTEWRKWSLLSFWIVYIEIWC